MPSPLDRDPRETPEEYAASMAKAARGAAAAPPFTPEMIARLRPIFAAAIPDRDVAAA
jgi:hypothetical protein